MQLHRVNREVRPSRAILQPSPQNICSHDRLRRQELKGFLSREIKCPDWHLESLWRWLDSHPGTSGDAWWTSVLAPVRVSKQLCEDSPSLKVNKFFALLIYKTYDEYHI